MPDDVVVTDYKCTQCGETDRDRGANPPAPVALVCWNCKVGGRDGGRNPVNPFQQAQAGFGMIRLDNPFWSQ